MQGRRNILDKAIVELIRRASTELPRDVIGKLREAFRKEHSPLAKETLKAIIESANLSKKKSAPLCQDTGTLIFEVFYPRSFSQAELRSSILLSIKKGVRKGYLRPNAVEPLSNKNTGTGVGDDTPKIYFREWRKKLLLVNLMLKGGGCENVSAQYSLPDDTLKAGRDIAGIGKCILDSLLKAQGRGCSPGIIGVCIGGDRSTSMERAKLALFRKITKKNKDKELQKLEKVMVEKANSLGIGPMGLGGKTTILGMAITKIHRIPASFFVSVAYMCWACRRSVMMLENGKTTYY